MIKHLTLCFLLTVSGTALAQPAEIAKSSDNGVEVAQAEKTSAKKAPKKITDRNHPDYVRCRTESVIGSLAKKRRICLTNSQWKEVARNGNDLTEEFIRTMRSGLSGG